MPERDDTDRILRRIKEESEKDGGNKRYLIGVRVARDTFRTLRREGLFPKMTTYFSEPQIPSPVTPSETTGSFEWPGETELDHYIRGNLSSERQLLAHKVSQGLSGLKPEEFNLPDLLNPSPSKLYEPHYWWHETLGQLNTRDKTVLIKTMSVFNRNEYWRELLNIREHFQSRPFEEVIHDLRGIKRARDRTIALFLASVYPLITAKKEEASQDTPQNQAVG